MRTSTAAPAASTPTVNMQAFTPLAEACRNAVQALDSAISDASKHQIEADACRREAAGHLVLINVLRQQIRLRHPGAPGAINSRLWAPSADYSGHGRQYNPVDGDIELPEPERPLLTPKEIVQAIEARLRLSNEGEALALSDDINLALIRAGGDPLSEPTEKALTVGDAVEVLKKALQADEGFAWVWHANIAVTVGDSGRLGHRLSNKVAAHLMRHLFDVDMSGDPHYQQSQVEPASGEESVEHENRVDAAIATLERLGYTHTGGVEWRPPLGRQPIRVGIDLSAEAMEELGRSDGLIVSAKAPAVEFFEHRLFTEKASEVRTLLSGIYDRAMEKRHTHITLSFGQLCDVMSLLEPVRQDGGLSEKIIANAAAIASGLRAPGETTASTLMPEPYPLDVKEEMAFNMTNTKATARAVITTLPAGTTLTTGDAMIDSVMRPADLLDTSAESTRTYDWEKFVAYGVEHSAGPLMHGLSWSFDFHGHAVTHENDSRYLIGGFRVGDDMLIFNKGDILTLNLETKHISIQSPPTPDAPAETAVKPSGNRRVFVIGDIVRFEGHPDSPLCEVIERSITHNAVRIRPCDPATRGILPGEWVTPCALELAPTADAAKAVGQMNAVNPVEDNEYIVRGKIAPMTTTAQHHTIRFPKEGCPTIVLDIYEAAQALSKLMAPPPEPGPIKPIIGRRVWFFSDARYGQDGLHIHDHFQPLDAGVVYVWNDRCVNLDVTDHQGNHHAFTSVTLVQPGDEKPAQGYWCEWMPYQKAQAAK